MNILKHPSIRHLQFLALMALFALPMAILAGKPIANVDVSGHAVVFSADAALYVRIGGPNDYFRELRGDGYVQWTPEYGLADGTYRYDCYASKSVQADGSLSEEEQEAAVKRSSSRTHGVFRIENGMLTDKDTAKPNHEPTPDFLSQYRSPEQQGYAHLFREVIGGALNALVPAAQAADQLVDGNLDVNGYIETHGGDITVRSNSPEIDFFDENANDDTWRIYSDGAGFLLIDQIGSNDNTVLQILSPSGSTESNNAILVGFGGEGDVSFADMAVYIDRSAEAVGIGTTTPLGSLHIVDSASPELILEDSSVGASRWELKAHNTGLAINGYNPSFGTSGPFAIWNDAPNNTLVLGRESTSSANVGMGTKTPETGLHITRADGNGIIKVEESNSNTTQRFQVQLRNNGGTGFKFTDTSVASREWQNAMLSNGDFAFSFIGTGGAEVQVKPSGEVRMGPGPTINFQLKPGGDLSIPNGKVTATAFETSSSRSVKQDFTAVDEAEVLDKLLALEITEWEYRDPGVRGRHLGPMAEEFHAAFGFGTSDKHIYPADMASVSLVAARQIHKRALQLQREAENRDLEISQQRHEIQEQDTKITRLEERNAEILEQNAALITINAELNGRLTRLEQLVERISTN